MLTYAPSLTSHQNSSLEIVCYDIILQSYNDVFGSALEHDQFVLGLWFVTISQVGNCLDGRGLEHLHENCKPAVIHRDLKASNILLDASFNAKVGLGTHDNASPANI